jgi:iron complex outermembrane receptor protein
VGEVPLNDANTGVADPYQLLNIKATYDWEILQGLDLRFTGGVNNLLDQNYAASVLPNAIGFGGAAPRFFYPGNPRNYFAGLGLHYEF